MADCGKCYRQDICNHRYTSDGAEVCSEYWPSGEWIPCDEIMPDINYQQKMLLVTVVYPRGTRVINASYHVLRGMPNHWRGGGSGITDAQVIAWMPYPKPYVKEDEKTESKKDSSGY